ncbi:MAG: sulfatase-like hydrolase/transferase [Planctomycetota bacterium]
MSDQPQRDPAPSALQEVLLQRTAPVVAAGALAGALDGAVRVLGIDPGLFLLQARHFGLTEALGAGLPAATELPGRLLALTQAVFHYALLAGVLGAAAGALGVVLRRVRGGATPDPERVARVAFTRALGLWLAVALYWSTRSVVYSGLPATDPRRLAAAAVILAAGMVLAGLLVRVLPMGGRRAGLRLLGGAALIGAGVTALGLGGGAARGRVEGANADLPNVLLVVVDALRQDTLGPYGDPEVHTPSFDRLAAEGVTFTDARTQAPFTWPSFGSFLTGKVPRRHGLIRMEPGLRFPVNATLPVLLKQGVTAEGEALDEEDWIAGAFMTGTLSHGSGLLGGFDAYLEALVGHELVDVHDGWSEFRSGLLPWLVLNKLSQKQDRHLVTSTAERWLREHADRRFMAMVHLYSTHTPYDPAPEFRERHLDPSYDGPITAFYASQREAIEDGEYTLTPADELRIRRLYLAGVEQADRMIGRLLATLEGAGVLDDTIVIVTSDHGESLGEHGLWEHNWMYEDNLRVPLLMRFPGGLPAGARVEGLVDTIDLLPTVLDLAGLEAPERAEDVEAEQRAKGGALDLRSRRLWDAIDGRSLVPLVHGEAPPPREVAFAENGRFMSAQSARWKLIVRRELVREGTVASLLREDEAPRLFDLEADPAELVNRFRAGDEEALAAAERLLDALRAHSARLPIREDQVLRGARDLRAEGLFKSLGYGGGVGADDQGGEDG